MLPGLASFVLPAPFFPLLVVRRQDSQLDAGDLVLREPPRLGAGAGDAVLLVELPGHLECAIGDPAPRSGHLPQRRQIVKLRRTALPLPAIDREQSLEALGLRGDPLGGRAVEDALPVLIRGMVQDHRIGVGAGAVRAMTLYSVSPRTALLAAVPAAARGTKAPVVATAAAAAAPCNASRRVISPLIRRSPFPPSD